MTADGGTAVEMIEALNRFLRGYATLAKLPPPTIRDVALGPVVERVAALQPSPLLTVVGGPDVVIRADPDQLEPGAVAGAVYALPLSWKLA
jgi:hypothetical protein